MINPSFYALVPQAPLGTLYIAAVAEQDGNQVKVLDGSATAYTTEDMLSEIGTFNADVVGISGHINTIVLAYYIGKAIKESYPEVKIVFGGPQVTALPMQTMEKEFVDFVLVGESEYSFRDLIRSLDHQMKGLEKIPGLYYRQNNEVKITRPPERINNLDNLPFPARHLIPMERYVHRGYYISLGFEGKHLNLMGSRGCPNNCFFCYKSMFGRRVTYRSISNIVDEIELECRTYDIPNFELSDYDWNIDPKRVYQFCHELNRRNLKLNWFCKMRVSNVTEDLLKTCQDAGMKRVSFGVESADERVLKLMRKNINLDKAKQVFKWTKKQGIISMAYFMVGNPGDNEESVQKTLDFCDELECDVPNFCIIVPVPGSDLYEYAVQNNWIRSNNWEDYTQHHKGLPIMRNEALSHEELKILLKKCTDHVYPRINAAFQKFHGHDPSFVKEL